MKLTAPKRINWIISLLLAIIAVVGRFFSIPMVTKDQFWILLAAWLILFLGTTLKKV